MTWPSGSDNDVRETHRRQWEAVERGRLQCVEQWPESDYKRAVLSAILASLAGYVH